MLTSRTEEDERTGKRRGRGVADPLLLYVRSYSTSSCPRPARSRGRGGAPLASSTYSALCNIMWGWSGGEKSAGDWGEGETRIGEEGGRGLGADWDAPI
jgi:hypothetical protein